MFGCSKLLARIEYLVSVCTGIDRQMTNLERKVDTIMATLDQVLADVTAEATVLDSISTLIAGLKQQLADALSGTTLPPAVQAKVDTIFADCEANREKLVTALGPVTPPVGTPVPAPVPVTPAKKK